MKRFITLLLCLAMLVSVLSVPASAANVTTVSRISQSSTSALNYLKSKVGTVNATFTIPGLNQAVTRTNDGKTVTTCKGMVPQGFTFVGGGKYALISAYCDCGAKHRSVIYVMDGTSQAYLTTLILDNTSHVGGLAGIGDYVWVCDSSCKSLRAYKYSSVTDAIGHNYWTLATQATVAVAVTPSYMCAANNYLYVGSFSETATTTQICFYQPNGLKLTQKGSFTVKGVTKLQGISIRNGYMVLTSSYGRTNASNVYVYKDTTNLFKVSGKTYSSPSKTYSFANMVEACYIGSSYTYFLFESGAASYRSSLGTRPLDQYVRFTNTALIGAKP